MFFKSKKAGLNPVQTKGPSAAALPKYAPNFENPLTSFQA